MEAFGSRGGYASRLKLVTAVALAVVLDPEEVEIGTCGGTFGNGQGVIIIRLAAQCTTICRFGKAAVLLIGADARGGHDGSGHRLLIDVEPSTSPTLFVWVSRAVEAAFGFRRWDATLIESVSTEAFYSVFNPKDGKFRTGGRTLLNGHHRVEIGIASQGSSFGGFGVASFGGVTCNRLRFRGYDWNK